jgi:hypothetical protein
MPLIDFWKSTPTTVKQMTIEQIVAMAGDGKLTDNSLTSTELRSYFSQIPSNVIYQYIDHCLTYSFTNSGFVLQDLVNELGRRLDFNVENGIYRGKVSAIGSDGFWTAPEGNHIVVEVKTTDSYRISLETIVGYKERFIQSNKVRGPITILLVVGRDDTGELEAQVRGSRYAWDVRLISTDALYKLVEIKEGAENNDTLEKIRGILIPVEYTRVDRMVDVLFTAAKDVESSVEAEQGLEDSHTATLNKNEKTDVDTLQKKREAILSAFAVQNDVRLVRKTRATYWDDTKAVRAVCTISKRYSGRTPYWYAYHPSWNTFLQAGGKGYFILGCTDLSIAFVIPVEAITPLLSNLHITEKQNDTKYWHIKIIEQKNEYFILVPNQSSNLALKQFELPLLE